MAARMPMMAMTTNSSIKVNARRQYMLNQTPPPAIPFQVFSRQ
jgi:hypothetical protein